MLFIKKMPSWASVAIYAITVYGKRSTMQAKPANQVILYPYLLYVCILYVISTQHLISKYVITGLHVLLYSCIIQKWLWI